MQPAPPPVPPAIGSKSIPMSMLRSHGMARSALAALNYLVLVAAILAVLAGSAFAAKDKVFAADGLAIRGYDPVAYFTEGKPVKGTSAHATSWNGATWQFSSAGNLAKFEADPGKYAPQYGGYCAWAVSQGYTASIDPSAWKIVDGKLYLNYSSGVQSRWQKDIPGNISKANGNWPGVLSN